jgi:hypothetical protein
MSQDNNVIADSVSTVQENTQDVVGTQYQVDTATANTASSSNVVSGSALVAGSANVVSSSTPEAAQPAPKKPLNKVDGRYVIPASATQEEIADLTDEDLKNAIYEDRREKDYQREKVETAEKTISHINTFKDHAEAQAFLDKIMKSRWWKNRYEKFLRTALIEDNKDNDRQISISRKGFHAIFKIPAYGLNEFNVVRLLVKSSLDRFVSWNGTEYIDNMLKVSNKFMGETFSKELKTAYKNNAVKLRKPKEKTK